VTICAHPRGFCLGRGKRTPATLLALDERDRYLIEAARHFPGASGREISRRLRIALLRYREGAWRRTRVEALCPPRHAGRVVPVEGCRSCAVRAADQSGAGTHVNISGAGVAKNAARAKDAQKFIEWLSQPDAQARFAGVDLEYPASPSAKPAEQVAAWGEFKPSLINVARAGELQPAAVKLMDRAGYL